MGPNYGKFSAESEARNKRVPLRASTVPPLLKRLTFLGLGNSASNKTFSGERIADRHTWFWVLGVSCRRSAI